MVYSLMAIITRRNLPKLTVQTWQYKKFLVYNGSANEIRCLVRATYADDSKKKADDSDIKECETVAKDEETSSKAGSKIDLKGLTGSLNLKSNSFTSSTSSAAGLGSGSNSDKLKMFIHNVMQGKVSGDDVKALTTLIITEAQYKQYSEAPQHVQMICFCGLAPFVGIPLLMLFTGSSHFLMSTHLAYSAIILSFLGGSNWYHAFSKQDYTLDKLIWSIAPPVIGWTSLVLPIPVGVVLTSIGFCTSLAHDVLLTSYPQWFKSLRLLLTAGVLSSLGLSFVLNIMF